MAMSYGTAEKETWHLTLKKVKHIYHTRRELLLLSYIITVHN